MMVRRVLFYTFAAMAMAATGCPMSWLHKRCAADGVKRCLLQSERQKATVDLSTFNAQEQILDVHPGSVYEYRAPRPNDSRGPCPV